MERRAGRAGRAARVMAAIVAATAATLATTVAAADGPAVPGREPVPPRWSAPLQLAAPAPFVDVALPPSAHAHSLSDGLADLRVVDARGRRVPFAWLPPPEARAPRVEQRQPVALYPLPAAASAPAGAAPDTASPIELVVEGRAVTLRTPGGQVSAATGGSPGWLFDLGADRGTPGTAPPQALELAWSGPAEFSVGYWLSTSDDLRQWRPAGGGQLLSVASASGALSQRRVDLPAATGRYVRLAWDHEGARPALTGATVVATTESRAMPADLATLVPPARPVPATLGRTTSTEDGVPPGRAAGLEVDLGGAMPVETVDLQFAAGTHVVPADVYGRDRAEGPWRLLARGVFDRLERPGAGGGVVTSSPLAIGQPVRQLRLLPDPRAAALDPADARVVLQVRPVHLVFATQGEPPFSLAVGAEHATPAALPVDTLVPAWHDERARFGTATVGAWREDAAATRAAEGERRAGTLRTAALWGVLVAGVALLGAMVWRLVRTRPAA